jgi:BlaI family penicillinase repressor
MARPRVDVTEAELSVLQELWGRPEGATIRQLTEAIYPDGGPSRAATVQKLLERLEEKGCVARDRSGPVQRFAARVAREDLIGLRLRAVAESLCGGSLTPLLTHLVEQSRPLKPGERQALRDLIDRLSGQ